VEPQGYIATIRLAQLLGQHEIVKQGLVRLARLPGQQGVALSVSANLVSQRAGPEKSIKLITNSPVDLTDPANEMALDVLVGHLLKLDRAKAAEKYVLAALDAHPESADFHALHGYLMWRRGAAIPARRGAFQRAIQLDESQATALTGLAVLEAEEGNYDRAIELYDRASRADPEQAGPAIAALRLLRKHAPLEEQEARGREFLLRHLHSAILASELAQIVATRGKDPAGALGLARRSARFDRGAHAISIRAFEAVAEMASESASAEARSALEQLRPEKS
jgi:tetratricopeptide (TPR) repeat protein